MTAFDFINSDWQIFSSLELFGIGRIIDAAGWEILNFPQRLNSPNDLKVALKYEAPLGMFRYGQQIARRPPAEFV